MVLSLFAGIALYLPENWGIPGWVGALETTHFHLFVVGWITQMIFGVALWFFPKRSREAPRGPEWIGWTSFGTLNAGLVLRAVSETAVAGGATAGVWNWVFSTAAVLQFVAALLFAVAIWPRVKGRKKRRSGG